MSTMDNQGLDNIIKKTCKFLEGGFGHWKFDINGVGMICMTDEYHNRMRIISPITLVNKVNHQTILSCMEANFHTALDAKYAISDGAVWAAFIHPLKELTEAQAINAISQVHSCAKTFGTTYSSGDLIFPKAEEE